MRCSRTEHADLFRHVVGGYGLFGVVTAVTLRLVPRVKVERCVARLDIDWPHRRIRRTHRGGPPVRRLPVRDRARQPGVPAHRRVVELPAGGRRTATIPTDQRRLSQSDWNELLTLAHSDKRAAFQKFTEFYLATHGQLYWSDTHQLNLYLEDYHGALDHRLGSAVRGSEMITELYVPRAALRAFMNDVRRDFRANGVDFIYGTIRLIEAEHETALPWARENWACVIFNLHIDHRREDVARAADHFRRLIDHALRHGGSYFLTYHRFASAAQVVAAHPAIRGFLAAKRRARSRRRVPERLVSPLARLFA